MNPGKKLIDFSVDKPVTVTVVMLAITVILALLAVLPSVMPDTFSFLHPVEIDTNPENMLPEDEPVRVFHDKMKEEFSLYDMIVVGIVNEKHPEGVFNPRSLKNVYKIANYAKDLKWKSKEDPEKTEGVVSVDMIAPSMVDNIEPGSLGEVKFEWLMPKPPETQKEALEIRRKAMRIPFFNDTLVSQDGKAIALYLPITSKDVSHKIYMKLKEKAETLPGNDEIYITGLPVAEDTFGVEMFKQMAISAPVAMLIIFILMLIFFRKFNLVISPLIVAVVSVITTMALLVVTGQTIHIMSSMIPIFIMPIAVLDAVHILSEFFDRYQEYRDRRKAAVEVMKSLFVPMLYTSLTTSVGFASLALTPIPPVQVFGLFVAFGVMSAWFWTITFIPSFIMFVKEESLENFGMLAEGGGDSPLTKLLSWFGKKTYTYASAIIVVVAVIMVVSFYGISTIQINDNPTKWFEEDHPIRIADKILNDHFGGTYMAYLAFEKPEDTQKLSEYIESNKKSTAEYAKQLEEKDEIDGAKEVFKKLWNRGEELAVKESVKNKKQLLEKLQAYAQKQQLNASDERYYAWDEAILYISKESQKSEVFKNPEALEYIEDLQKHLLKTGSVGKSNSITDIVKTVYRELRQGKEKYFTVPDSPNAVGQCLLTYQNSHRPQDLWHFVTPDYKKTSIWIQLKSGDNKEMSKVVASVNDYIDRNPPPFNLEHNWFGLTYINVIWQDKMVSGMLQAFLGSFLAVFLMMTLLYRSSLWGILCMIPLTVTIAVIYGLIGFIGKDYDMPVAVLSSLALGLAVDYSIHFLTRSRNMYEDFGNWKESVAPVFGEPARAISRNAIVIGIGFLPLLLAPLVPYQTVGFLIAAILLSAGATTLIILPAAIKLLEKWLFPESESRKFACNCGTCIMSAIAGVALVAVNVHQFVEIGYTTLSWFSVGAVLVLALICFFSSRRESCKISEE